jgi:hypothetical protein
MEHRRKIVDLANAADPLDPAPQPHHRFTPQWRTSTIAGSMFVSCNSGHSKRRPPTEAAFYLSSTNKKAATSTANQTSVSTMKTVSRRMGAA